MARNQILKGSLLFSMTVPLRNDILLWQCLHWYISLVFSHQCSVLPQDLHRTPSFSRCSLNCTLHASSSGKLLVKSTSFILLDFLPNRHHFLGAARASEILRKLVAGCRGGHPFFCLISDRFLVDDGRGSDDDSNHLTSSLSATRQERRGRCFSLAARA